MDDEWKAWGNHVLSELTRLSSDIHGLRSDLKDIYGDVSALKAKAGIWGMIGGCIPVLVLLGVEFLKGGSPF